MKLRDKNFMVLYYNMHEIGHTFQINSFHTNSNLFNNSSRNMNLEVFLKLRSDLEIIIKLNSQVRRTKFNSRDLFSS